MSFRRHFAVTSAAAEGAVGRSGIFTTVDAGEKRLLTPRSLDQPRVGVAVEARFIPFRKTFRGREGRGVAGKEQKSNDKQSNERTRQNMGRVHFSPSPVD
jgi:hypothetical protein